jgi:hypothetical protein
MTEDQFNSLKEWVYAVGASQAIKKKVEDGPDSLVLFEDLYCAQVRAAHAERVAHKTLVENNCDYDV